MYSIYEKTEHGIIKISDNFDKFASKIKVGQKFTAKYLTEAELRSEKSHRYLRGGIYPTFVPSMFQNAQDVHKHYGDKWLSRTEFVKADETEKIDEIKNQSRENDGFKITTMPKWKGNQLVEIILRIDWVKSTKALKQKELTTYIDQIIFEGSSEHGLYFENIDDYWNRLNK